MLAMFEAARCWPRKDTEGYSDLYHTYMRHKDQDSWISTLFLELGCDIDVDVKPASFEEWIYPRSL